MARISTAVGDAVRRLDGTRFDLRTAVPGDERLVLDLLDEAVAWLTSRGNTEQWGSTPFSAVPRRVAAARAWVDSGGTVLAFREGRLVGALVVGGSPAYVPAPSTPEVYVVLLVASRHPAARGVGTALLDVAAHTAAVLGRPQVRVDCYAGGDQALVRFYTSAGFTPTQRLDVDGWPGCVLERPVQPDGQTTR